MPIYNLSLDMPIGSAEVKAKGYPDSLCRLLIALDEDNRRLTEKNKSEHISKIIYAIRPLDHEIWFYSIGEFISLSELKNVFGNESVRLYQECNLACTSDLLGVSKVIASWSAEHLVIMIGIEEEVLNLISLLPKFETKWWQFTRERYEAPFLNQLDKANPIIFYAKDHASMEIFGTKSIILNCFDKIRSAIE